MNIAHLAIWTKDLEGMKDFYTRYFNGRSNEKYCNPTKQFESYFISFQGGTQLELMRKVGLDARPCVDECLGICHFAFQLESKDLVLALTETLRKDGFTVLSEARTTGDGYFESVVLDLEGNRIELVAI